MHWSECKIEVSLVNIIQLYTVYFMNFMLLDWRWPYWVETCCQNRDIWSTL